MKTWTCHHLTELPIIAQEIIHLEQHESIWLLEGEMGAGKTTLAKALCHVLGVKSLVQSPTFSIVNEYVTDRGEPIYHFDFYRLRSEAEALDIGIEEYFDSGALCLIEWSAKVERLIPAEHLRIDIEAQSNGHRFIRVYRNEQHPHGY